MRLFIHEKKGTRNLICILGLGLVLKKMNGGTIAFFNGLII